MERQIALWIRKVRLRKPLLGVEPVCSRSMKLLRARFRRQYFLHAGRATVLGRIGVDLNTRFLNRFGIWSEIEDTLTNSAGHVQSIDHVHVRHLALTIGAGIHLGLCRKVVHA